MFINTRDTFKPLAKKLYLTESLADYLQNMDAAKSKDLCSRVKVLLNDIFIDSSLRFDKNQEIHNDYVFRDKPF